jgi:hypothetical protein
LCQSQPLDLVAEHLEAAVPPSGQGHLAVT